MRKFSRKHLMEDPNNIYLIGDDMFSYDLIPAFLPFYLKVEHRFMGFRSCFIIKNRTDKIYENLIGRKLYEK